MRAVVSQEDAPGRGCHEEHESRKPGPGGPERRNQQDLLLVIPALAKCLCEQTHWGKRILEKGLRPAVCQCIRADGGLGQGVI